MKINKKNLKKIIDEEVKKFLSNINNDSDENVSIKDRNETKEAPVETPVKPGTKSPPKQRPLKIPKKWPGTMPKPKPKAENKEHKKKVVNEGFSFLVENMRMRTLMEDMPMDIEPSDPDLGEPHQSIRGGIEGGSTTPFSAVELFNTRSLDQSMLEKLGSEEYNAIVKNVIDTEKLDMQQIMNTYNLITTLENQHHNRLENLALTIVKNKFGLPDEIVEKIKASLVQDGEIDPPDSDDDMEEEVLDELTPEQQAVVKKHLDKRIVHNALMMGAGYRAHSIFDGIKNSLDAIDDKLYPLYKKLMPNMEIFMWKTPVEEMFGQRMMLGKSEIDIKPDGDMEAKAEATMFPILLHEVAKAAVEILFAQHLVDLWEKHGETVYKSVMKQSESYLDEHWMKLIGPRLWKYLHDAIDYVVKSRNNDYTIVSYILNRMAIMEPEEFMELMSDVLNRGDVAINKIEVIMDEVQEDIEDYENQNDETPSPEDISTGENNDDEIEALLKTKEDELLASKAPEQPEEAPRKKLVDMEVDELNIELEKSIDKENFEKAGKIRDIINSKIG